MKRLNLIVKILFTSLLFFSPLTTIAATDSSSSSSIHEYHLRNGLKLIIKEDHRSPIVISQIWYKVGSSYEPEGITGISHALEHMMFKGTQKYGSGQFIKIIAENGGEQNAFTSYDYTGYYEITDANKLETNLKLEADRMRNLLLNTHAFSKEMQVVMEERRMRIEDNPQAMTQERLLATAFITNPYRHPVIGWMDDIKNMTVDDLRAWYKKWYAPNNAIIVIVGDVKANLVYEITQKYFSQLNPSIIPENKSFAEVKSLGERQVTVKLPAQLPTLFLAYHAPVVTQQKSSDDPYVLDAIEAILAGNDSARLPKNLIREQQILANVKIHYDLFSRLNNLFIIKATPAQNQTIEKAQKAIIEQIKKLQTTLITSEELNRVKAQIIANKTYEKDSIEEQANLIGSLEAVGLSWYYSDIYLKKISTITPEQIQQIAQRYFIENQLTIGIFKTTVNEEII